MNATMNHLPTFFRQLKSHAQEQGANKAARMLAALESKYSTVTPVFDDLLGLAHRSLHHTATQCAKRHQRHLPKCSGILTTTELIHWLCNEVEAFAPLAEKHLLSRCAVIAQDVFNLQSNTPDAIQFRVSQIASLIACHAQMGQSNYRRENPRRGLANPLSRLRKEEANWGWEMDVLPDLQMFLSLRSQVAA
jgi:hypothetical protein